VVVSAISDGSTSPATSEFADLRVRQKAVIESWRVLPIAFGIPLLIFASMLRLRIRR
jgi:hypothetical protein